MNIKELAFVNIVNAKGIVKIKQIDNRFWYLDYLMDYEIITFLLRDILVVFGKGINCYSDVEEDKIRSFISEISADFYFEEDLSCMVEDCLSGNESVLLSISIFYRYEKTLREREGIEIDFTHTAFCVLKGIVLSILSKDFEHTIDVTEGILCLMKYFDDYENFLLNHLHVKKATAINISIPSYENLKKIYCDKPNINKLLLNFIDMLEYEIVVEVDEFSLYKETRYCFDILDEWFNDKAVIICRDILYDCYQQEYSNYSELFDYNPYDEIEELKFETNNNKQYISDTITLFGKVALINDDNKLVTSFRYDSAYDAKNKEYIIVEKDTVYGWYRKRDMSYIEPEYEKIQSTEKWLKVCKYGYTYIVDYKNNRIENALSEFDEIEVLNDYVKIKKNNKYGLATIDGKTCIPILYDEIKSGNGWCNHEGSLYFAELRNENKEFCFDFNFNIIMELPLDTIVHSVSAKIYKYTLDNGKTGYFDISGKILFPALYEYCRKYETCYCFGTEKSKKIMFMSDKSIMSIGNQEPVECDDNLLVLSDSFSIRFIDAITTKQKNIYIPKYKVDYIDSVYCDQEASNKVYGIRIHVNGKQGIIDLDGSEILPPIYDFVYANLEKFNSKDEYYFHISNKGEEGELYGLADVNGNIIFDCEYETEITQDDNGHWIVLKNGCEMVI